MSIEKHAIRAIIRAIDFMEDSLKEEIGILDAADAAAYSLYHFCRLFSRHVHHSPYDYLIRRRLSEAASELLGTRRQIVDIAFDYQFNSHENFCRAFKRFTGISPNAWRKTGMIDRRFVFSRRTRSHLEMIHDGINRRPEFNDHPKMIFAGITATVQPGETSSPSMWSALQKAFCDSDIIRNDIALYEIKTFQNHWEKEGLAIMAAAALEDLENISPVLNARVIPAGTYAVLRFCGPEQPALDYLYQTYLPKAGRRPAYPLEIECLGHGFNQQTTDRVNRKIMVPLE